MGLKILFTPITSSSIAHIIRCFTVADEMHKRGNKIYFTSCDKKKSFLIKQGYKVVKTYKAVNVNDPKDQSVNFIREHQEQFINWFQAEIDATKIIKPDVVVVAPAIFGPYIYYATGVPVISIMDVQYLGDQSRGLMGISRSTNRMVDRILTTILRPIFEKKFTKLYLSEIMKIYSKLNIKDNMKSRSEVYKPMAVMIPADEYTQPLRKKQQNICHIGPLFWDGFEKMDSDLTEKKIKNFKEDKKLIYLMFGGSVFKKKIYKQIINAVIKMNYKLIVCIGPNFDRKHFIKDNKNLIIRNLVPGMRLSKLCDIIVNIGSQGSVIQGLWWGKPQVAIPIIMDQAYYANRLQEMQLGINANPVSLLKFSRRENFSNLPKDISIRIRKSIEEIFENSFYSENALKFKKKLRKYKSPAKAAADFIESYVK